MKRSGGDRHVHGLLTDVNIRTAKPAVAAYTLGDNSGLFSLATETGSKFWR
jgi:hypothetical protein